MATLTDAQLADYDRKAGWPPDLIQTAVAIERAESGGDPAAIGPTYGGDAGSWGLFQIQSGQHPDLVKKYGRSALLSDPLISSKAGLDVFNSQGWSAWSTYTGGQYKKYLSGTAATSSSSPPASSASGPGGAIQDWWKGVSGSIGTQLGKGASGLQIVIGLLVVAAAVGIFAYLFLTRTDVGRQMARGAKMAAVAAV